MSIFCRSLPAFVVVVVVVVVVVGCWLLVVLLFVVVVVVCCCLLFVVVVVAFLVVMLSSRQEGGHQKRGGAKKWNNLHVKSKGAVMFPNVKIIVLLFFVRFVCMFIENTIKIGVSTNFRHCVFGGRGGQKAGSTSGPHQGQQVVHILARIFES